ncbi:hypothetical protein HN51_055125, partial [Arachis hypogaea]
MEAPNLQPRLFSLNGPSLTASPSPRHSFVSPLTSSVVTLSLSRPHLVTLSAAHSFETE